MKKEDDILWIFLHVPKTAGNTFVHHIEKSFERDELMNLYALEYLIRNTSSISRNSIIDYADHYTDEVKETLGLMPSEQKDRIKIIFGHYAYFGIHEFFNKTPRYIGFVREPDRRTISMYNHLITRHFDKNKSSVESLWIEAALFDDGKMLSFGEWLKKKYGQVIGYQTMVGFLGGNGYIEKSLDSDADIAIESIIDKFYFIGTTENFKRDSQFLYYELGVNKFYRNRNISRRSYASHDSVAREAILERNIMDQKLYSQVLIANSQFRATHKNFEKKVKIMNIKMFLIKPFTQSVEIVLEFLYKISFWLRARSLIYSRLMDLTKKSLGTKK